MRMRKPPTISVSARCARISLTDPFVRSGTLAQSARRDSFDQAFEFLCCGGLHG